MGKDVRRVPSTRSYRDAVRSIIATVQRQYGLNDTQLADRIGCAANTVRNAKREHSNLDGVMLATIEHRFGPGAVDPFLALGGSWATPLPEGLPRSDPIVDIVDALHRLVQAQHSRSEHGFLITSKELLAILHELRDARLAFDALILLAEPGLRAAPEEVRHWFHHSFDGTEDDRSSEPEYAEPDSSAPRRRPAPADFADVAAGSSVTAMMRLYGASRRTVERWLRDADEELLARMRP